MKLAFWDLKDASRLTGFYNRQIVGLPYCHPVTPGAFDWGIQHDRYEDTPHENLEAERLVVAEEGGRIVGFVHFCIENRVDKDTSGQSGLIRFLSYEPGRRACGQALLEEAEKHLDQTRIKAFLTPYIYRFYFLGYGVSQRQGHVTSLLGMSGYKVTAGEVLLAWENYQVGEPVLPQAGVEIRVDQVEGRGALPGLMIRAYRNGHLFGTCQTFSMGQRQEVPEVQEMCFVRWLGVNEKEQHRGWGRYLWHRTLWEMQQIGYQHTLISANIQNYRALLFYTNYGYRVLDTTYSFEKRVSPKE
jgi:hypothetical protein